MIPALFLDRPDAKLVTVVAPVESVSESKDGWSLSSFLAFVVGGHDDDDDGGGDAVAEDDVPLFHTIVSPSTISSSVNTSRLPSRTECIPKFRLTF
jgi:hypothetical protein